MSALAEWIRRRLVYFAVLRPSYIFGLIVFCLPLTAMHERVPGNSMLGNLFVEYHFGDGFWFGLALFGAVWAVMLTACLSLDIERDRQLQSNDTWIPDPDKNNRKVTIPLRDVTTFVWFSLLGAPGVVVTAWKAESHAGTIIGLFVGGLVAYVLMSLVSYGVQSGAIRYQAFPWKPPFGLRLDKESGWISRFVEPLFSGLARFVRLPDDIFTAKDKAHLDPDNFFAAWSLFWVGLAYFAIYRLLKPNSWTHVFEIAALPPAAFIYALLLPLIWLISALWIHLQRYRIILLGSVVIGFLLYWLGSRPLVEDYVGGPTHTYDVFEREKAPCEKPPCLTPYQVVEPLRQLGRSDANLIIVAASGGGILAAGWTTKVLTELHKAYPNFRTELRLISSVSGGSVGSAHYVSALPDDKDKQLSAEALRDIVEDSMKSSLAITAYGVAFPDFRRTLVPIGVDQEFDRGRLLEADWRKTANCRKLASQQQKQIEDFRSFCRGLPKPQQEALVMLSDWREVIRQGKKPAVIFNTTVMETGERIAITPLSSLNSEWAGKELYPARHSYARTLSEFLGKADQYDVDVWTGARLSATFSYVSPAARAALINKETGHRDIPREGSLEKNGLLHLIDGGYHDNYGVASALDWLTAMLEQQKNDALPFARIVLVEIRAKPDIPPAKAQNEWSAAWLGPFWGLMNSWGFTQTSSNDTAVNRLIAHFKRRLQESQDGVQFESFVFVPEETGPLSWHLSDEQKQFVRCSWECPSTRDVLRHFLSFVDTQFQAAPQKNSCSAAELETVCSSPHPKG